MTTITNGDHASDRKPRWGRSAKREIILSDRLPPHSTEMEQAVLGCILIDPKESIESCAERLPDGPLSFYDLRHQEIYKAALAMHEAQESVDIVTLQQKLKDVGMLEQIGGIPYLNQLQDGVPSVQNLPNYLEAMAKKWTLRKIVQKCAEISQKVYDYEGELDPILDEVERSFSRIEHTDSSPTLDGKELAKRHTADLERRFELKGALSGLDTGLHDLNRMTEGLQFGEQAIIGARPSMGKTALGLGIMMHAALHNRVPCLFVSLEMSVEAVMRRLNSSHTHTPLRDLKSGRYDESKIPTFTVFSNQISKSGIHIVDGVSGVSIESICARVRRHVLKFGVRLVVVDYLQKITTTAKFEKRTYELAHINGRLKALAVETNVAVLTLAQLNRENVSGRQEKPRAPKLSDLAECGQIERDADLVGLLHRKENEFFLIIAKQRDGETGAIRLDFDGPHCRFRNAEYGS